MHAPQAGTVRNFELKHGSFRGFLDTYHIDILSVQVCLPVLTHELTCNLTLRCQLRLMILAMNRRKWHVYRRSTSCRTRERQPSRVSRRSWLVLTDMRCGSSGRAAVQIPALCRYPVASPVHAEPLAARAELLDVLREEKRLQRCVVALSRWAAPVETCLHRPAYSK